MDIAHTMPDQVLGLHPDYTVSALKKQLGVSQLEVVVLGDIDEYRELLTEKTPPHWTRRRKIIATVLVVVALAVFSGIFHPGVRLDRLVKHISVEVH